MTQPIIVRHYERTDRDAVRKICFETGFMGDSIGSQYGDFKSYADMFTSYYTDAEPENAFVGVLDGQVVGYALVARDYRKVWHPMSIALKHAVSRLICLRPGTAKFYWRCCVDTLADIGKPKQPAWDLSRWPSTVHVNLLPAGRNGYAGKALMGHAFDRLVELGSPGVHGEGFAINQRMVNFWKRTLEATAISDPYPVPGLRTAEGQRVSLVLGVRSFDNYKIRGWDKETAPSDAAAPKAERAG